jgi:site-specific DNA-methyltransferase (adenine-specific)
LIELNKIYNEDCLGDKGMSLIPDKSIDMILCDLPYGVTARNKWDVIIPFEKLWDQYERVIKDRGMICLTATQPFATQLINSNKKLFKYDLIWDKKMPTGFLNAKRQPLRRHEYILCFYKKMPTYNPIMRKGKKRSKGGKIYSLSDCYGDIKQAKEKEVYDEYYPTSILEFGNANQKDKIHPTQKPLELFEYLIRTYTDENETVLDNCSGSGTTAEGCINLNRNFICFEKDVDYWKQSVERIHNI